VYNACLSSAEGDAHWHSLALSLLISLQVAAVTSAKSKQGHATKHPLQPPSLTLSRHDVGQQHNLQPIRVGQHMMLRATLHTPHSTAHGARDHLAPLHDLTGDQAHTHCVMPQAHTLAHGITWTWHHCMTSLHDLTGHNRGYSLRDAAACAG
jgi:hypothetical protein